MGVPRRRAEAHDTSGSTGRPRAVVSWSSGKDAAFALHQTRRSDEVEIVGLLTTVTSTFARVSMHGVRRDLLLRQAACLGLPLTEVEIPSPCPNEVYEAAMAEALAGLRRSGVTKVIFGDLFLADVRRYREERLAGTGVEPLFPLWGLPTDELAKRIVDEGFETRIVCLDPRRVPRSFAGRRFDYELLRDLPKSVDPCGENGEFHTCVLGGPGFSTPIEVRPGEVVERDGFVFADLLPVG